MLERLSIFTHSHLFYDVMLSKPLSAAIILITPP
jgi:hypothetical protein